MAGKKPRDYRAEYAQRKGRWLALGEGMARARGHAAPIPAYHPRLEEGLRRMRRGATLRDASRSIGVSPERLRRYLAGTGVVERQGRRLAVVDDRRSRAVVIYSGGTSRNIEVSGFEAASLVGRYMASVERFLATNDAGFLDAFRGISVTDRRGREYKLETNPRTLYRLTSAISTPFDEIYRIVV
jgi:hypothetical protein